MNVSFDRGAKQQFGRHEAAGGLVIDLRPRVFSEGHPGRERGIFLKIMAHGGFKNEPLPKFLRG
jgi:hypothetical protein